MDSSALMIEYRTGVDGGTLAVRLEAEAFTFVADFAGPSGRGWVFGIRLLEPDDVRDLINAPSVEALGFSIGIVPCAVGVEMAPFVGIKMCLFCVKAAKLPDDIPRPSSIVLATCSAVAGVAITEEGGPEFGSAMVDAEP